MSQGWAMIEKTPPAASKLGLCSLKWPGALQLLDDFNLGLAAIRADGRYRQISEME